MRRERWEAGRNLRSPCQSGRVLVDSECKICTRLKININNSAGSILDIVTGHEELVLVHVFHHGIPVSSWSGVGWG